MRIFKEITLPTTCYVPEVALWVALGRAPEYFENEDGEESRGNYSGELAPVDEWGFSEREFSLVDLKVDMDRYLQARTSFAWLIDVKADVSRMFSEHADNHALSKLMESAEIEAAEAEWARGVEEAMVPLMDRARATVFQALASGLLLAKGWQESPSHNPDDSDEWDWSYLSIDPKLWSLRGFDWEHSELSTPAGKYSAVSVNVEDMLRVFSAPSGDGTVVDGLMYSETIIIQQAEALIKYKKGPGRPPKSGGDIRTVVMNVFSERKRRGDLPEKTEAILAEVIDFVQTAFKQSIVRSTAQSYIAGLNLIAPENLPENAAG
jgi:hypothetical protein